MDDESQAPPALHDRLSELPDSLIISILSLSLSTRDAVRTTILSKRWKDLWTTVPSLDFMNHSRDFICGALARWQGTKLLKFSINFYPITLPQHSDIDSWLLYAMEKQVEELSVDLRYIGAYPDRVEYCAPQRLYSCSSLTNVSLISCYVEIDENVQWNRLKSLHIEGLNSVSEQALNRILSGAPLLEELILCFWEISENLNIRSTSLKTLHIGRHNRDFSGVVVNGGILRIWAPNLLTLQISAVFHGMWLLDVPSLSSAILHIEMREDEVMLGHFSPSATANYRVFPSICNVEKVTLSVWCTQFLVHVKKKDMVVQFSNAKFLKLYVHDGWEILCVLEMFPNLMTLKVKIDQDCCLTSAEEIHAALVACNSMAPMMTFPSLSLLQLKTVDIYWWIGEASIVPAIEILLENGHMLEKMMLRLGMYLANPETFTLAEEKVMSMSRSSPYAEVIISKNR
ncbi:putative F-box protein At1g49610 [Salvia miltiorrhiza]|uniref:putative F-box protein At1g49610 n=1 Tax=Salvia miltiorrhiza TaxID=226208 RepID=UPI0025ACB73C|nr:putative F-box protein At1g49610 [Salvia miltiorrhiza]